MTELNADRLMSAARDRTGLVDFGDDRFVEPFRRMVAAIEAESVLTEDGANLVHERFMRLLVNRLRFREDVRRHPEILEQELAPPLVILGLPRTGSTKLQRMMSEAGSFRSVLMWQGFNPAPFPGAEEGSEDPRIAAAAEFLAWRSSRHEGISKAHHTQALEPEEELYLIELSFTNWAVGGYYRIPSYIEWLRTFDRDHVYQLVKELLQYLQWQHYRGQPAKPWLLKSPPNLGHEEALQRHFPGAHFVMLHRDVREAFPSLVSLTNAMRHQYLAGPPDLPEISAWLLTEARDMLDRHMAWRAANPDASVIDVAYRDVVENDEEVVARIHRFCGIEPSPSALAAMTRWSQQNAQHRHGEHVYSLDGTGLSEGEVLQALRPYVERYQPYF